MERRELPTHLHVEDKLIAGLTIRQVLFLCVGVSVGYSLWLHLAGVATAASVWLAHTPSLAMVAPLAQVVRLLVSALPVLLMVLFVLVRPADRPLEEWLLVALRYVSLPKAAVWRSSARVALLHEDSADAQGTPRAPRPADDERGDAGAEEEEWTEWSGAQDAAETVEAASAYTQGNMSNAGNGQRRSQHAQGGW